MNVYRTAKGTWVGTLDAWRSQTRDEGGDLGATPEKVDVPINPKSAMIDFLNGLGTTAPAEPRVINSAGETLDEMFDSAPPRRQLELAVRAIDNADSAMSKLVAAFTALRAQTTQQG